MINVMLADGFEEMEALSVVDIARRAGIEVCVVSVNKTNEVCGAHKINVIADCTIDNAKMGDMVVLPGGIPGVDNLFANQKLIEFVKLHNDNKKLIAAICAAPSIIGRMGLLSGKRAICYPGNEQHLKGADVVDNTVVTDGRFITSKAAGTAYDFALKIVEILKENKTANKIREGIFYK